MKLSKMKIIVERKNDANEFFSIAPNGDKHYLFNSRYAKSVYQFYRNGVMYNKATDFSAACRNTRLCMIMERIPAAVYYVMSIEKIECPKEMLPLKNKLLEAADDMYAVASRNCNHKKILNRTIRRSTHTGIAEAGVTASLVPIAGLIPSSIAAAGAMAASYYAQTNFIKNTAKKVESIFDDKKICDDIWNKLCDKYFDPLSKKLIDILKTADSGNNKNNEMTLIERLEQLTESN